MKFLRVALSAAFALTWSAALAADYPAPKQGDWIAKDFKFHSGETMPELAFIIPPSVSRPASRCWCCTVLAALPRAC